MKTAENTYDVIVIGSGITGGWAAKEFCERGFKTLLLERGKPMDHPNYPAVNKAPWELEHANELTQKELAEYPIQKNLWEFNRANHHFYMKDAKQPYVQKQPFWWFRGDQVGGKSLMWNRNCYRYSDLDFEANLKDGHGIDWPIRYKDIEPWYDYVEKFIGLSGENCGLEHLPDQILMPHKEMNCIESHIRTEVEHKYQERKYIHARAAVLTQPHNGRGECLSRNQCKRGCPSGAYFSSNTSTIPAAIKTGNLTIRPYSVVESIVYDEKQKRASGVKIIDSETKEKLEFFANIISLNASTIGSTAILLNSVSESFPNGLGNSSGTLGHYLSDHTDSVGAWAMWEGEVDKQSIGQRPNQMYMPRFRNIGKDKQPFLRGYAFECISWKKSWDKFDLAGAGVEYKEQILKPGNWETVFVAICESLPDPKNKMTLSKTEKDPYGLPLVELDVTFGENTTLMREDAAKTAKEMLESFGLKYTSAFNEEAIAGRTIHEFGTARMSNDPKLAVLNKWNQLHDCPNVILTDGSALNSSPCQNPSLTYMALTVRAIDHICKTAFQ
jgi:choline dehydrogenase-like flavoprotein